MIIPKSYISLIQCLYDNKAFNVWTRKSRSYNHYFKLAKIQNKYIFYHKFKVFQTEKWVIEKCEVKFKQGGKYGKCYNLD